jgi:hypothetical protein
LAIGDREFEGVGDIWNLFLGKDFPSVSDDPTQAERAGGFFFLSGYTNRFA